MLKAQGENSDLIH